MRSNIFIDQRDTEDRKACNGLSIHKLLTNSCESVRLASITLRSWIRGGIYWMSVRSVLLPASLVVAMLAPFATYAAEIDLNRLTGDRQTAFDAIAEDIATTAAFIDPIPEQSFIIDLGVAVSAVSLRAKDELREVGFDRDDSGTLYAPRLYFGWKVFSIGALATYTHIVDGSIIGAQLSYDLWEETILPGIIASVNHSRSFGIRALQTKSSGLALTASKSLLLVNMYARFGYEEQEIEARSVSFALDTYKHDKAHVAIGGNLSIGFISVGLQLMHTGRYTVSTLSIGT